MKFMMKRLRDAGGYFTTRVAPYTGRAILLGLVISGTESRSGVVEMKNAAAIGREGASAG